MIGKNIIPNAKQAQKYRIPILFSKSISQKKLEFLKNCENEQENCPTVVYGYKNITCSSKGQFNKYCRIFSGSISKNKKFKILSQTQENGLKISEQDLQLTTCLLRRGNWYEPVPYLPAGCQFMVKSLARYFPKPFSINDLECKTPLILDTDSCYTACVVKKKFQLTKMAKISDVSYNFKKMSMINLKNGVDEVKMV